MATGGTESEKQALGRRITAARTYSGNSKLAVAEHVGVAEVTMGRWERGDTTPNRAVLEAIARFNGVPDWFVREGFRALGEWERPPSPGGELGRELPAPQTSAEGHPPSQTGQEPDDLRGSGQ